VATDKLIHKLATSHAAAVLKLFKIPDGDDYQAGSFTFKEVENRRDIIFEKVSGDEAVLLEAQGYDDEYFLHRTVMGRMMYHIQKKFTGKLRTIVMFLEEAHYRAALKLAHHFDGTTELAFQPTIFIFDQKEVAELENLDDVRLVPLYPLCKISPERIKMMAPTWAERIKTAAELPEVERRGLRELLGGFLMHRLKESHIETINQILGDLKMEDTQAGKDLIEMGSLQTKREDIIDLLTFKLGRMEEAWQDELNTIRDLVILKTLYRTILQAKTHKQVQAAFDAVFGNGKKAR